MRIYFKNKLSYICGYAESDNFDMGIISKYCGLLDYSIISVDDSKKIEILDNVFNLSIRKIDYDLMVNMFRGK